MLYTPPSCGFRLRLHSKPNVMRMRMRMWLNRVGVTRFARARDTIAPPTTVYKP